MTRLTAQRLAGLGVLLVLALPAQAGTASGTLSYQTRKGPVVVSVKHAYLVKGPDVVSGKTIRRVVLSVVDVGSRLKTCATMMCSDGGIGDGMTVDLDAGPRVNYWFVADDQRVQYSGSAQPETMKLTADSPQRVAGTWEVDDAKSGGVTINVQFDADLVKELE